MIKLKKKGKGEHVYQNFLSHSDIGAVRRKAKKGFCAEIVRYRPYIPIYQVKLKPQKNYRE